MLGSEMSPQPQHPTRNAQQATANAAAAQVPPLGSAFTAAVRDIYDRRFRAAVHPHW